MAKKKVAYKGKVIPKRRKRDNFSSFNHIKIINEIDEVLKLKIRPHYINWIIEQIILEWRK